MKKIFLSLLILIGVLTITACGKSSTNDLIKIVDKKDRGYVTTFQTKNNNFVQKDPQYNHVDNEKLGIFLTFDYIESSKESYEYYKTHNFLGVQYSANEVKDYKWNNYSGYSYGIKENEMSFRILLEDDGENVVVLDVFVGPKEKTVDFAKIFESNDFQNFLNSVEFQKENK